MRCKIVSPRGPYFSDTRMRPCLPSSITSKLLMNPSCCNTLQTPRHTLLLRHFTVSDRFLAALRIRVSRSAMGSLSDMSPILLIFTRHKSGQFSQMMDSNYPCLKHSHLLNEVLYSTELHTSINQSCGRGLLINKHLHDTLVDNHTLPACFTHTRDHPLVG